MKISYNWLQKYFKEKLPEPNIIAEGIIFHSFEIEEQEKFGDDTIFDIKILPDRAHDCLSHWGIAKEISVIFNIKINDVLEIRKEALPEKFPRQGLGENLQIEVKSTNCRRYMGRVVKGVKVGPSPAWLSNALVSIGQKSINNIVDATNYVMFDLGNPIHAFDLDKLASSKIIIENAKQGEKFILLDGREVTLDESMLTIRDEKDALVVAGVKGGKKAEIDNNTKNIMIEVANFDPISVRKTSKKLAIYTDSAKRFENELSSSLSPLAMDKITDLIIEVACGESYEVVDVKNSKEEEKTIKFSQTYLNNMLGVNISKEKVLDILKRFNYDYKNEGDDYEVKIPSLRLDMTGSHDMVEEVGRIYGYENIAGVLPKIPFEIKENTTWVNMNNARNFLVREGYREVMNYAFADNGDVEIMASASDKNFLRTNLTDGMKKSFELNKLNLSFLGDKEIKIFEIGTVFPKGQEVLNVCFANKKEIIEMPLDSFVGEKFSSEVHGYFSAEKFLVLGSTASQGTSEENSHPLKPTSIFKPWSLYPFITRDIAVWVPEGEDKEKLKQIFIEEGTELLVKEPYLFDSFNKDGRTSYAYRLVFQSYNRNLKDEEINLIMNNINKKISLLGWEVR